LVGLLGEQQDARESIDEAYRRFFDGFDNLLGLLSRSGEGGRQARDEEASACLKS